jgi:hypothetical protein
MSAAMETKIIVVPLLAIAVLAMPGRTAQAQSATGDIRGMVVDPSGAAMANVAITVEQMATGIRRELTANDDGRFIVPGLPPGVYEVSATLDGFAVRRQEDVALRPGRTVTIRLELDKARAPDTITIGTTPRVIDTAQSYAAGGVGPSELLMLPLVTRHAFDLARVVPGATGSLRPVIDGTDAGDQPVSLEAVRELTVFTAVPPVEYSGALVAAATRTGTNRFSGSAFDFVRDSRTQFGGTLGGPIVTDRHFFFGSYDGTRLDGQFPGASANRDVLFVRTDHVLAQDHRLGLRVDDDVRTRAMASSASALGRSLFNEARVSASDGFGQIADTLTFVHGGHQVRSGFDLSADRLSESDVDRYAVFVQDQWWINGSTTIDGGVRFGREWLPFIGVLDDDADWQPRVGAAWGNGTSRLAVRGAWRGMGDGVYHATGGVEWEWLPHVSIGGSYLDYRLDGEQAGGVALEIYRRFAQGLHYRMAYTRGIGDPASPVLSALLPRHRLSATAIYTTNILADRHDGIVKTLLKDWTLSGVYAFQTSAGNSLDPRIARDILLADVLRVSLLWEAFNLMGNDSVFVPRTHQVAARVSF